MFELRDLMLIIDDREQYIYPLIQQQTAVRFIRSRLTIGDFAIINTLTNQTLCVIERKSYDDFSASIKDGRYANKQKMIDYRADTGSYIYYLIEGKYRASCNIPWNTIESSIFHMQLRDNIQFIYSKNLDDSVSVLGRFMKSMTSLLIKSPDVFASIKASQTLSNEVVPAELKKSFKKSVADITLNIWCCLPGIGATNADLFMQHFTLKQALCGIAAESLNSLFGGSAAAQKSVIALGRAADINQQIRLLSCITGISKDRAAQILGANSLLDLLNMAESQLAALNCGKKTLGPAAASLILQCFNYQSSTGDSFSKSSPSSTSTS